MTGELLWLQVRWNEELNCYYFNSYLRKFHVV